MRFNYLPFKIQTAAKNMAEDLLLLEAFPQPHSLRFRAYGWKTPAWTFGYTQKIRDIHDKIPKQTVSLCRRPTGGGLVNHASDWTYSLVIPPHHPLCKAKAISSYLSIHQALAETLDLCGIATSLQTCNVSTPGKLPPTCFTQAALYDVILSHSGKKIAGAAQKRNRHGLLIQGSIESKELAPLTRDLFFPFFIKTIARSFGAHSIQLFRPQYTLQLETSYKAHFSSDAWNNRR